MGRKKINKYHVPIGSQEEGLQSTLRLFGLDAAADCLAHVEQQVHKQDGTYYDFLDNLLEKEIVYKEDGRLARWMQQARFPFKKTIRDFDFSFQPSIKRSDITDLLTCRYVQRGRNIIFLGQPGVGKTHLSVSLGIEAIHEGYETRFLRLDELIEMVELTDERGSVRLLRSLVRPKLLILDDIDFYDTGKNASEFLFKLMGRRYDSQVSTILTSNKTFDQWEALFGGSRAEAAVDRIVGGAYIINISGNSYRTKDNSRQLETVTA